MSADHRLAPIDLAHEASFRLGGLEVSPSKLEVVCKDRREVLEPRVMQVLVALARERGEIVSRDDLIASCWAGRIVGEDAINRCTFRSDPRFWRAAARAGYLDYWRKRGVWPDFCYDPKLPFDCRRAAVAATG